MINLTSSKNYNKMGLVISSTEETAAKAIASMSVD